MAAFLGTRHDSCAHHRRSRGPGSRCMAGDTGCSPREVVTAQGDFPLSGNFLPEQQRGSGAHSHTRSAQQRLREPRCCRSPQPAPRPPHSPSSGRSRQPAWDVGRWRGGLGRPGVKLSWVLISTSFAPSWGPGASCFTSLSFCTLSLLYGGMGWGAPLVPGVIMD